MYDRVVNPSAQPLTGARMMRNHELLLSLLEEMSKNDFGRLTIPMTYGMDEQKQKRYHHVELLVDAGHAEWTSCKQEIARITNAGYDFLNAARSPANGEKAMAQFVELYNNGVSYARAAQAAVELVARAMGA